MSNIIQLTAIDREPRADSRDIAGQLGTDHRSSMRLIDRYAAKFERFGQVRFEIAVGYREQGGGKAQKFALLNEDQCYFLLSLSRNLVNVVDLKANLVQAFGEARRAGATQALTVWQELQALQLADADSLARASFGSNLMLERKQALPNLRQRRLQLEREFAPQLLAG